MGLLHVALQNREQVTQLALAFFRIARALDAMMGVLMNDDLGKRLQRLPRRDDLGEDFRAVPVIVDHAFDRSELPGDLVQANFQRPLFIRRVRVICSHELQASSQRGNATAKTFGLFRRGMGA